MLERAIGNLDDVTTEAEDAALRILEDRRADDPGHLPERHAAILWKCAKVTLAIWLIRAAKRLVEGLPSRA